MKLVMNVPDHLVSLAMHRAAGKQGGELIPDVINDRRLGVAIEKHLEEAAYENINHIVQEMAEKGKLSEFFKPVDPSGE